jgi:hypothetical protein
MSVSSLPRLISSAACDSERMGRVISICIITFMTISTTANTPASDSMKVRHKARPRAIGCASGTETNSAPITSFMVQPKPLAVPYLSVTVAGAAAGVLWHCMHAASVMRLGRARKSARPPGASRSPDSSFSCG